MKRLFFLLSVISALCGRNITISHGPYLCDMATDGLTVVWTTDLPGPSWVEIENIATGEKTSYYETIAGNIVATETLHRVHVNKLLSGTKYRYRIYTGKIGFSLAKRSLIYRDTVASDDLSFTTFSESKKDISFLVLNDIHSRAGFMQKLCSQVNFGALDFVCFNGDMWEWLLDEKMLFDGCMDAAVEMFASETPIVFNRGNHETRGPFATSVPDYFPTRNGTVYYRFNIGDISFLVLDCGEDKEDSHPEYFNLAAFDSYREEEARWLAQTVASPEFQNAAARIVFLHVAPAAGTSHVNMHLQETIMPILNRTGIDIMFSGHTHSYACKEADAKAAFPTVINGNNTYLLCTIKDGKIQVEIKGLAPSENHTHEFQIITN
ncbi:MAG: metallophosphoesterase [Bacteroidales bacterium]|jgi:hypothetical protein|nr:metallophosphoesterase [Bacteroidales bacterium]